MPFHDDKHVISAPAVIQWDGITRPETNDSGTLVHNLKVALPAHDPTVAELQQLATTALNESEFKGQLPHGGLWPISEVDPSAHEGVLAGYVCFNAKKYSGVPQVYNEHGVELNAMQYGSMLRAGAFVRVLVSAFAYNKKSKGISFGLEGIQICEQAPMTLPGVGGVNVASAFGGGQHPAQAAAPVGGGAAYPQGGQHPAQAAAPVGGGAAYPQGAPHPAQAAAPPVPPTAAAPPVPPTAAAPPVPPTAAAPPHPGFLTPGGAGAAAKVMTPAATATYESYIAQGWTDAQLIENGLMQA